MAAPSRVFASEKRDAAKAFVPTEFERLQDSARLHAQFKSFGAILSFYEGIGIATPDDITRVRTLLQARGIVDETALPQAKIMEAKVAWGKTEILRRRDGSLKNRSGVVLHVKSTGRFYEAFEDAIAKLEFKVANARMWPSEKTALTMLGMSAPAFAAEYEKPLEKEGADAASAASAALSLASDVGLNLFMTVVGCPLGTLMASTGGYASLVRSMFHPLRTWINEGKIECSSGGYFYKDLDLKLLDPRTMVANGYVRGKRPGRKLMPVPQACGALVIYGAESTLGVFFPDMYPDQANFLNTEGDPGVIFKSIKGVPKEVLNEVFPKPHYSSIPECNVERAEAVRSALLAKARNVEQGLLKRFSMLFDEARLKIMGPSGTATKNDKDVKTSR